MKIIVTAAAILAMGVSVASATEWMGSLQFTKGAAGSSNWTATVKNGAGKMSTDFGKFDVQKSNSFFIISSNSSGIVGTGVVHDGRVVGTFAFGAFGGNFSGDRTSASKSKSRGK